MSFYARNFIYNGVMSQELGLTISSANAESTTDSGSNVNPIIQKIYRRPVNYLLGVEQAPNLTFPVSFNSESKINAVLAAKVELLLFGKMGYKKLQVIQPDMSDFYWNCFLTDPQLKTVGGEIVGWDATVNCNAPWGFSFQKTAIYPTSSTFYTPPIANIQIAYNNRSGNNDYSYPIIEFTMGVAGGSFGIINTSDDNRTFSFTGLSANEVITVDNDLQIITSSTGLYRLNKFNKKFLRLVYGLNNLVFNGGVKQVKIKQTNAQKIGG